MEDISQALSRIADIVDGATGGIVQVGAPDALVAAAWEQTESWCDEEFPLWEINDDEEEEEDDDEEDEDDDEEEDDREEGGRGAQRLAVDWAGRALGVFALRGDETMRVALVRAGAYEIVKEYEALVAIAGRDATWTGGAEPRHRIMYRARVEEASFDVPAWAEERALDLSAVVTAFRGDQFQLAFLAKAFVLANGDELAPPGGFRRGPLLRAVGDRLLESVERALLENMLRRAG